MRLLPIASRLVVPSMVVMGSCGGEQRVALHSTFDRSARPDPSYVVERPVSGALVTVGGDRSRAHTSSAEHAECR